MPGNLFGERGFLRGVSKQSNGDFAAEDILMTLVSSVLLRGGGGGGAF